MKTKSTILIAAAVAALTFSNWQPATAQSWAIGGNTVTKDTSIGTKNSFALRFITNNAERVRITSSGNVGIGTKTPSAKLDIVGINNWDVGSTEGDFRLGNSTYRLKMGVAIGGGGAGDIRIRAVGGTNRLMLGGGAVDVLTVNGSGKVGIGTIAPGFPLSFASNFGDKIALSGSSGAHYGLGIQSNLLQIHADAAASDIAFGYGTSAAFTERMRIKGNGNVGIGTTTPGYLLDVAGRMRLRSGGGSAGTWLMNAANTADAAFIGMVDDNNIGFYGSNVGWGLQMNTITGNVYLPNDLYLKGDLTMHAPGISNFFVGPNAGNTAVTGGYNTATGTNALHSLTTGNANTANGVNALYANTTGGGNTANGYYSLYANTTGFNNTANGYYALKNNTSGSYNEANGNSALRSNSIGNWNTANGYASLLSNTTGGANTANGYDVLYSNTTGHDNTGNGDNALYANTIGYANTANGVNALYSNTIGYDNIAIGNSALSSNTSGNGNTANGYFALYSNTTGSDNTAVGDSALYSNTIEGGNTAVGNMALYHANGGQFYGGENTAVGYLAGTFINTGYDNTFIGAGANASQTDINFATALGYGAFVDVSNTVRIGNGGVSSIGGYVGWSNISDGRIKKNIKNNVPGLAFINKLHPVTYNLDLEAADRINQRPALKTKDGKTIAPAKEDIAARKAKEQVVYTGFVAQEVEKAAKELNYDFSGVDAAKNDKDLYALRYAEFVVPLVKAVQELSKQTQELSKKNDEKDAIIADLQKRMNKLEGLKTTGTPGTTVLTNASLDQNQPNPFASATTIRYSLPAGFRTAQIVITDNTGKAIKQVQLNTAGDGTVNMDASTLSSGTYSYTLVVDGKVIESKKMIVAH